MPCKFLCGRLSGPTTTDIFKKRDLDGVTGSSGLRRPFPPRKARKSAPPADRRAVLPHNSLVNWMVSGYILPLTYEFRQEEQPALCEFSENVRDPSRSTFWTCFSLEFVAFTYTISVPPTIDRMQSMGSPWDSSWFGSEFAFAPMPSTLSGVSESINPNNFKAFACRPAAAPTTCQTCHLPRITCSLTIVVR
jgi:hypothetical protein